MVLLDARGMVFIDHDAIELLPARVDELRRQVRQVPRGAVVHNWMWFREVRAQQSVTPMYPGYGG
jgi:hypothetical protein